MKARVISARKLLVLLDCLLARRFVEAPELASRLQVRAHHQGSFQAQVQSSRTGAVGPVAWTRRKRISTEIANRLEPTKSQWVGVRPRSRRAFSKGAAPISEGLRVRRVIALALTSAVAGVSLPASSASPNTQLRSEARSFDTCLTVPGIGCGRSGGPPPVAPACKARRVALCQPPRRRGQDLGVADLRVGHRNRFVILVVVVLGLLRHRERTRNRHLHEPVRVAAGKLEVPNADRLGTTYRATTRGTGFG